MIEAVLAIVISLGAVGYAEYKHHKAGNGKRFERIHELMELNRK